jgi:hypothetical protein
VRVLIACEYSGATKDAFRERGHDAWSCDLDQEPEGRWPEFHLRGDVRQFLTEGWDLMVAHPPCTYLASSGLHWNHRTPGRAEKTEGALALVRDLMAAPIERIAIENPVGCIGTRIRKADQMIQPYEFGDDASKATCLWLKALSPLRPTRRLPGRIVTDPRNGKPVERWANQTDGGQNRLAPSADRWKLRSTTYPGIADAMADQWGEPDAALPLLQRMTA